MVSRLGTGEFLVGGVVGGGEIFVYDSSGAFSRTIGRSGEGPGEFGFRIRIEVGPGDTLYATDEGNARFQALTASGEYVRSFSLPGNVRRFTLLGDGSLLFFRELWKPHDKPLYQLDTHGNELAVFGAPTLEEWWPDEYWVLAPSSSGGFWTARVWEYVLNKWEGPGHTTDTLIRQVGWFPLFEGFPEGMYETEPAIPALIDLCGSYPLSD